MRHPAHPGTPGEVLRAFALLGLTAVGGPVAHLAHFRRELVERRAWLDAAAYGRLVALCQFLPGPTSSQVGFLLGWRRAGLAGALAAWTGFTLPSALLMAAAGLAAVRVDPGGAWLAGVEAAVLAVVAQAVAAMGRALCPGPRQIAIAAATAIACLALPSAWMQVAALIPAGIAGLLLPIPPPAPAGTVAAPLRLAAIAGGLLAAAAAGAVLLALLAPGPLATVALACLRAGSLVFGGGHVVLPLLHEPLVAGGVVGEAAFLAGYGAAQMVPGPLFTIASYLGAAAGGVAGALLATLAIFLPGLLLALAALPAYDRLAALPRMRQAVGGLNAGVVGLLAAALWHPLGSAAARDPLGLPLALAAFIALAVWSAPPWAVVGGAAALAAGLRAAAG